MYIYRIGRSHEEDYYLAHDIKFSQEEFDDLCETAEKDDISRLTSANTFRYNAMNIRDQLIDNFGFKDLDELCICTFDKDGEVCLKDENI